MKEHPTATPNPFPYDHHEWHETYDNVTRLGRHLVKEFSFNATELQAYYEKPWKWAKEWDDLLVSA